MYRVLIVDDEPEIRQGLQLKVNWESLGLTIAGEAGNGAEAMAMLADEPFDIVITDMNMPLMNGVSLLESCQERYPELRLLVITGYEDIRYAKAAVRHQARDFLLKPVARDELSEALTRLRKELDDERAQQNEAAAIQWRLSQYYKEMKEQFILQLVKENLVHARERLERAKLFQLGDWDARAVRFLTTGLRDRILAQGTSAMERTPDQLRLPFELICGESLSACEDSACMFRDPSYPGLVHIASTLNDKQLASLTDSLKTNVSAYLGMEPFIGIGHSVIGLQQWGEGYMSSLLTWNLADRGMHEAARGAAEGQAALSEDAVKVLRNYAQRGDIPSFETLLSRELEEALKISRSRFVKVIFQLYLMLEALAHAAHVPLSGGEQLWLRPEKVLGLDSVAKARGFLVQITIRLTERQQATEERGESSLIEAVQQYIDDNYMFDLNLTMIAERFNYHPSYFSELFKAKAGKTFIQYVTDIRMRQATRLLEETQLSLWDIAELTGFSNASYFSSKFKKVYGMSPSEYRQQRPEKIDSEEPKK
ncbi:two-component system response regulator YesN [Paenibacillus phyllosphaerae]|uniref:Two-component system response regulator YesN n=1 Tax=Paenibacillus phyllosphaerae TaxID=274593 RepID=A0A7W5AZI5_9BACL|nr:response regulator [Paenibacillus phyllosphaerae]MBB3111608.1 two-component system response regulator YesN [Paenibacillus phyllosphaerae]